MLQNVMILFFSKEKMVDSHIYIGHGYVRSIVIPMPIKEDDDTGTYDSPLVKALDLAPYFALYGEIVLNTIAV